MHVLRLYNDRLYEVVLQLRHATDNGDRFGRTSKRPACQPFRWLFRTRRADRSPFGSRLFASAGV
jgi:hypothetical protein